jgi:hypothetical protein
MLRSVAVSIVCNITNQNYRKCQIMARTEKQEAYMKKKKIIEGEWEEAEKLL